MDQVARLLIHDTAVLDRLRNLTGSLSAETSMHEDMMQVALIHLWQLETQRPAQTVSWYVKGCRFRLQHYLNTGRSLDSMKRRAQMICFEVEEDAVEFFDHITVEQFNFDEVIVRDLMSLLARKLSLRERDVLKCLVEGLNATDIARRLHLSSPTVHKYRRKIAELVVKLGATHGVSMKAAA